MISEGKLSMEKIVGEDDLKGLEEEIDCAVDRLFVDSKNTGAETLLMEPTLSESSTDKKIRPTEPLSMESPIPEPSHESVKAPSLEDPLPVSPEPLPSVSLFEKMETQLLSLEWEITREHLEKTKEEVLALQQNLKERPNVNSVLNLMEKVLIYMINNQQHIHPQQIKFLLDSKEAIKLLLKKETNSEVSSYKQLVFGGIGARFLCLEGLKETKANPPSTGSIEEEGKTELLRISEEQIEKILGKMNLVSEKLDEIISQFENHLSRFSHMPQRPPEELPEKRLLPLEITIFKVDDKFFGIESQKVFKLFKLPNSYQERISGQRKIRLKEFEIQMVDLKRTLSIGSKGEKAEIQILTVKENGEYKGWMVDQILKKLSIETDISKDYGEYFMGMARWTYQEKPVKVPILNLKKI
jgi:chemotaxis protein histidine kinase CheA